MSGLTTNEKYGYKSKKDASKLSKKKKKQVYIYIFINIHSFIECFLTLAITIEPVFFTSIGRSK